MKKANLWIIAFVAIITIAFIGCKEDDPAEQPKVQPDTPRTLSFGTDCKVTIKSDDTFLTAEWNTLCDKTVAAIERGYDINNTPVNHSYFEGVFALDISVVLLKFATYDCEVKQGDYTIYLKTSALDTVDLQLAVWALGDGEAYHNP